MSLSEKVKMEAMSETMSLIIQNGECMTELESIQIMKKLLEIIGEMYESGKLLTTTLENMQILSDKKNLKKSVSHVVFRVPDES